MPPNVACVPPGMGKPNYYYLHAPERQDDVACRVARREAYSGTSLIKNNTPEEREDPKPHACLEHVCSMLLSLHSTHVPSVRCGLGSSQGARLRVQDAEAWVRVGVERRGFQGAGSLGWVADREAWVSQPRGVSAVGFRVLDFGFRVSGFGFRVLGFGFRVSGFGSGV